MGVTTVNSTLPDGFTPICTECGVHADFDISEEDYYEAKAYWDAWLCDVCAFDD